jgi:metal-responsive CopG/Arc/MetJ family transcriptional regulator
VKSRQVCQVLYISYQLIAKKNCYLLTIIVNGSKNDSTEIVQKLSDVSGFNYIRLINVNEING